MKIAITGGTGFLGRKIVNRLTGKHELVIFSRSSKVGVVQTDYSFESLNKELAGVDAIIHLAANRSASKDIRDFYPDIEISQNLFMAAKENAIKNIVFASSISVYSDESKLPWKEDQDVNPVSMYGISKLTIEMIANNYNRNFDMKIKNLRLAHLFGPSEKNNYMINLFFRKAFNKQRLELNTASTAKREFLFVEDAVEAFANAIEYPEVAGTFNIASGDALTNYEVAEKINEVFDNKGNQTVLKPDLPDDSKASYMDGSRAKKELNFENKFNFEDALQIIYDKLKEEDDVPIFY